MTRIVRRGGHAPQPPREFDGFVADSVDGLLRAAYLIVWDFADAEDLVQECLFRVARRWPRVRRMEYPAAYARKVLVNLALDGQGRRTRARAELGAGTTWAGTGPDPGPGPQARTAHPVEHEDEAAGRVLGWVETTTDLSRALGDLAPRQRAVLVLRYLYDLSEADTADVMGCSVGTVKSTASRALRRLRETVDHEAPQTADKPEGSITR